jgi:ABC-type taurine transport system substrate-binding protein
MKRQLTLVNVINKHPEITDDFGNEILFRLQPYKAKYVKEHGSHAHINFIRPAVLNDIYELTGGDLKKVTDSLLRTTFLRVVSADSDHSATEQRDRAHTVSSKSSEQFR